MLDITLIKWLHPSSNVWVVDYIAHLPDESFCIISGDNHKYSFVLSKKLGVGVLPLLEKVINQIMNTDASNHITYEVINLTMKNSQLVISGFFQMISKPFK